jgi:Cu(I)/Ag(I) efflux system membrane protein CusA/SilA
MGYLIRGKIPRRGEPAQPRADPPPTGRCSTGCCAIRRTTLVIAALALPLATAWPLAAWAASSCRRWTRATCCTCRRPAGIGAGKAGRTAAADRSPDQDRAGGRERVRQGRPGGNGHRSGAAGDVRDHHPVQAARPVARRDDARQAGRGTRPRRQGAGLSNVWVPPIRNRIDMLATGIKSPVGVKVAGASLQEIDRIAGEIEGA